MHFIEVDKVVIADDRIRREFDPQVILELKNSIITKGLINPITLRQTTKGAVLVAGETRLRAMMELVREGVAFHCCDQDVPPKCIPFNFIRELSPELAFEAELEENTLRRQLTWQEEAAARKRLHDFRQSQATAAGQDYHEIDTAKELIRQRVVDSPKPVVQDILIGKYLDRPEVRESKTKAEAFAKAKKLIESQLLDAIGETVRESTSLRLSIGDAASLILLEPAESYDCICTDPPYGINVEQSGSMIANTHHYEDSPATLQAILEWAPQQFFRAARPMAHLYWFCDIAWFPEISLALKDAGWQVWRVPIIWDKKGVGIVPDPKMWPRRSYEAIVFAVKGGMPVLRVANDVINFAPVRTQGSAEKPKEVLLELLSRSVTPGAKVLDPFCGSGSIFLAAREMKLHATGFEINEKIAKIAKARTHEDDALI